MPSCGAHGAADDAAARQLGARWERPVKTPGPRAICGPPKKKRPQRPLFFSLAGPYSLPLSSRSPSLVKKKRPQPAAFLLARRTLFASLVLAMALPCEKKAAATAAFLLARRTLFASLVLAIAFACEKKAAANGRFSSRSPDLIRFPCPRDGRASRGYALTCRSGRAGSRASRGARRP